MKIVDIPKEFNEGAYHKVIDNQVKALSKIDGVIAIYQIGGLSTPGISDIDLVVVFEDGKQCSINPRIYNSEIGNYLFTHGLYGTSESRFNDCLKFTFFHNFRLLHGKDINLKNTTETSQQQVLKEQIALEFLFKMYVNIVVQKKYNTIKLRSLFLHIKALPYDFEFLNINPPKILSLVGEGVDLRNQWFSGNVSKKDVIIWFKTFFHEYEIFLVALFKKHEMYASSLNFKIAPNIKISNGETLSVNKKGFVFPDPFNFLDKKYFKALNKCNDYEFKVPLNSDAPEIIKAYFNYADEVSIYNKKYLPYFMTLTSSLKVYK